MENYYVWLGFFAALGIQALLEYKKHTIATYFVLLLAMGVAVGVCYQQEGVWLILTSVVYAVTMLTGAMRISLKYQRIEALMKVLLVGCSISVIGLCTDNLMLSLFLVWCSVAALLIMVTEPFIPRLSVWIWSSIILLPGVLYYGVPM